MRSNLSTEKTSRALSSVLLILFVSIALQNTSALHAQTRGLGVRLHPSERELYPPAHLLIMDPSGKRTGFNPLLEQDLREIPKSAYEREGIDDDLTGAHGQETRIIFLDNPPPELYELQVIGTESGTYTLESRLHNLSDSVKGRLFRNVSISSSQINRYLVTVSIDSIEIARVPQSKRSD